MSLLAVGSPLRHGSVARSALSVLAVDATSLSPVPVAPAGRSAMSLLSVDTTSLCCVPAATVSPR